MSENCEPADNLELERDDSGGTEDSMEGELVGNKNIDNLETYCLNQPIEEYQKVHSRHLIG